MSKNPDNELYLTLQQTWGLDFVRISTLINSISDWYSQDELVDTHHISHRGVGQVLDLLKP